MMYDSVRLLAKAVDDLGSLGGLKIDPVNCKQGIPWKSGNDVVKKILEVIRTVHFMLWGSVV